MRRVEDPDDGKTANQEQLSTTPLNSSDVIDIRIWKNRNVVIIKPLVPLRIAQILWTGSGQIILVFYAVILKQRGLTLLEVSSIFSVSFLLQVSAASICGIIADKMGYAKPVLLLLILGTLFAILSILLVPDLRKGPCAALKMDITCYNFFESRKNISFCSLCYKNDRNNTKSININEDTVKDFNQSNSLESSNLTINDNRETFQNYSDTFDINIFDNFCFENCSMICEDLNTSRNICLNREKLLFAIYYVLILGLFTFWSTGNRFFDYIALFLATKYGSNFGKESFIAVFGEFFIVVLAVFAMNIETVPEKRINYDSAYWCCSLALILTFISIYCTEDVKVLPGTKLKKKAWDLVRNIDTLVFIITVFIAGNGFSFNVNFHLWYLENLKASKIIIQLHSISNSFYGILILFTSKWWINRFGTNGVFCFGLLSYGINQIGYSFMYNPWFSLLLEITSMFNVNLLWVAFVIHSSEIAPKGLAATLNAIAGTVHYGVGRSSGIVFGGLLMNYFGARVAYRVFGCIFLISTLLFSIFLCMRQGMKARKFEKDGDAVEELQSMNQANTQEA